MNIKKVDDKPMVIHTKEKTKLHIKQEPDAKSKGKNLIQKENGMYPQMHRAKQDREDAIGKKNNTVKAVASAGTMTALDQMEGGNEVYESYQAARTLSAPAMSAANVGKRIYRSQIAKAQANKIKNVQVSKKIGKKTAKASARKTAKYTAKKVIKKTAKETAKETAKFVAKETAKTTAKVVTTTVTTTAGTAVSPGVGTAIGLAAGSVAGYVAGAAIDYKDMQTTNRIRKIKFFLDKLNAEEQQRDSFAKLVKDLILTRVAMVFKLVAPVAGCILAISVLLVAIVALFIAVIYNSPIAMFFPSISSGDTMQNVLSAYVAEFNDDVNAELTNHSGYDTSEKIYVDFEGTGTPDNYYDVLAVYMIKHGNGDTATDMTDKAKENLQAVFDDMCSYSISSRTDTETDDEGNTTTTTVKEVNVVLKTYRDMISAYGFNTEEQEMLEELMKPEYLALIGYAGFDGDTGEMLSSERYQAIVDDISDVNGKAVVEYALSKIGYPYSQEYRDSGTYYDCSSLACYAWQNAGVNIMYEGANTAAAEGKLCYDNNYLVNYDEMQPGDLIFYSYSNNGRFYNITHVAIYVGDGKVVEAANESIGVVYRPVQSQSSIVFIGRPR